MSKASVTRRRSKAKAALIAPMQPPVREPVSRACAYARQVCQLEEGCVLPRRDELIWDRPALTAAARRCSAAGLSLLVREVQGRYIDWKHRQDARLRKVGLTYEQALAGEEPETA